MANDYMIFLSEEYDFDMCVCMCVLVCVPATTEIDISFFFQLFFTVLIVTLELKFG